jgi:copper transport protein
MTTRARRRRSRVTVAGAALAAVLVALVTLSPAPVAAHAVVLSTSPADGARLDEAPPLVRVEFNERISADIGGLRVVDQDGTRVEAGATRVEGTAIEIDLRPGLGHGIYAASWRVISADGHLVRGAIVFAVGDAEPDRAAIGPLAEDGSDQPWGALGWLGRWAAYGGTLVAAGGALFLAVVYRGSGSSGRAGLVRTVRAAAAVGALGLLSTLPTQAARATGEGPGALFEAGVLRAVGAEGVGLAIVAGLVGLSVLAVGVVRSPPAAVVGAGFAAASFAATGHNRTSDVAELATVATVTHLWAAAAWLGGLVLLWQVLRAVKTAPLDEAAPGPAGSPGPAAASGSAAELGGTVRRFSTLAAGALVVVAIAGAALTWSEGRSLAALTSTDYGAVLLAKLAVVALVVAVAVYNNRVLVPALAEGGAGGARAALPRLRRTLGIESGAIVAVLAVTAVLVQVTPARVAVEVDAIVERVITLGDAGSVQVVLDPARTGPTQIHLYTFDPEGFPDEIAETLLVELVEPGAGIGPLSLEPYRAGPAHFQYDGSAFPAPGNWELTVRARVDRFTEVAGSSEVPVGG